MSGLYVHIPFCEQKCIYCNFYSLESTRDKDRFLVALDREIRESLSEWKNETVSTIFLGGGTPSILSPDQIGNIIQSLSGQFKFSKDLEVSMECNPGALNKEWLEGYRDAGVNRLSFGVQSFHDDDLQFLSRIHTASQAVENIRHVRDVFDNVSLDLIFALPGQTLDRWKSNLDRAIELGTDHVSAYALIFEEGTPLHTMRRRGEVTPVQNDLEADMFEMTRETLGSAGFTQYETSNYAKRDRTCRHNEAYWERVSYYGFGPSAHSFDGTTGPGLRWANVSSLTAWLKAIESEESPVVMREKLTTDQAIEEMILLGLRHRGIDREMFQKIVGRDVRRLAAEPIEDLIREDLLVETEHDLVLTEKGSIFADRIALNLVDYIDRTFD